MLKSLTVKYLPVWHTASRLKRLLQKVLDEPYALVKTAMVIDSRRYQLLYADK